MNIQDVLDPKCWAERTFGGVQLHDMRRTRRAVQAASNLAENPLGSLPAQMRTWKETKALYRLLDEPDVTFAALIQPHLQQTREQAAAFPVILLVQDTTDIDLSHRRHPSVAWDKSATNEAVDFSCKRCWPCSLIQGKCSDA
jgi:Transposase DNA-binding